MEEGLKFYNDLYHKYIYFLPCITEEAYERAVRKIDPKYVSNIGLAGGYSSHVNGHVFIWIKDNKLDNLGALSHESIHAANFILDDCGIKQDTENDEALTYLSQWIFEKCLKLMSVK